MFHHRWQRILTVAALLLTTAIPIGVALAAPAAGPLQSADLVPSCLQNLREDLGTVLPGSSSDYVPAQCDLGVAKDTALIPVTGRASSVVWSDAGASAAGSAAFSASKGWLDAGASLPVSTVSISGGWRDAGAGSR